jgi:hypothetical protein
MATKKIIDVAKELLEERIVSFIEPSERKVESARRKVEEAKQNLRKAEERAKNEQEQWIRLKREFENKINANKTSINNFKKKLNKAGDKVKGKYEHKLNDLEEKNRKMMVKIGKYKDEKVEKWEAFKNVFMRDMEEIGSSLNDLSKSILK